MTAHMWQENQAGAVDTQHPLIMRVCLSPEMPVIVQAVFALEHKRSDLHTIVATRPSELTLVINGVELTGRYGQFQTGIIDLDIAEHLRPTGWNVIEVRPSRPGHIEACLHVCVAGEGELVP